MSKITGDSQCPKCAANGGDLSKNHLIRFADGGAYCNRCGYTEANKGKISTCASGLSMLVNANDSHLAFNEIPSFPIRELGTRGIKQDIASHYGVRSSVDTATGEVDTHYYPITVKGEVVSYRLRELPKKFSNVGKYSLKGLEVELFGQNVTPEGGKRLLICEGQDDALAASQMLHEKYDKYWPSVVATIFGTANKQIADNLTYINTFEEVYLYMDMDKAGKEASEAIAQLIGEKVRIVKTSEKDANAMLLEGKASEFINSYFNAQSFAPEGFVTVEEVFEEATKMPEYGRPWPWPSMTKLTYGRRDGEGSYFGAGVKVGKSEALNQIAHHITQVEGGKIALFKLEEKPAMTVRKMAGKIKHKQFHKPDGDFTHEELIEGVKVRGTVFYDSYAATSWDGLKAAIRHAVLVEGCKDVAIDPLTRLTVGMTASEANEELERVSDELSKMAKDLSFHFIIFCHLKAPGKDKTPHERGGKVLSHQFTGSRSMMRSCYFMWGLQRNKDPELDEIERNTTTFVLLEDRAFGNSGKFEVFYNKETGDYLEPLLTQSDF